METAIETGLGVFIPEADGVMRDLWDRVSILEGRRGPAHITIMYPFLPPDEMNDEVLTTLEAYFAGFPSFSLRLSSVERFPQVLYLAPEPEEPFIQMTEGLTRIYPQTFPYGGVHTEVIPHLTLAKVEEDDHLDEVEVMFKTIADGSLPITARVEEVWLIEIANGITSRYLERFSLGVS